MGARELLGEAVDVVEEAVGLVLVFLLQFGLVDLLVVEGLSGCGNSMGGRDDWLEGASCRCEVSVNESEQKVK